MSLIFRVPRITYRVPIVFDFLPLRTSRLTLPLPLRPVLEVIHEIIAEGAALRGLGSSSISNVLNHIQLRHGFLNEFISVEIAPQMPLLTLHQIDPLRDRYQILWPASAFDTTLQAAPALNGSWFNVTENIDHVDGQFSLEFEGETDQLFFRLLGN